MDVRAYAPDDDASADAASGHGLAWLASGVRAAMNEPMIPTAFAMPGGPGELEWYPLSTTTVTATDEGASSSSATTRVNELPPPSSPLAPSAVVVEPPVPVAETRVASVAVAAHALNALVARAGAYERVPRVDDGTYVGASVVAFADGTTVTIVRAPSLQQALPDTTTSSRTCGYYAAYALERLAAGSSAAALERLLAAGERACGYRACTRAASEFMCAGAPAVKRARRDGDAAPPYDVTVPVNHDSVVAHARALGARALLDRADFADWYARTLARVVGSVRAHEDVFEVSARVAAHVWPAAYVLGVGNDVYDARAFGADADAGLASILADEAPYLERTLAALHAQRAACVAPLPLLVTIDGHWLAAVLHHRRRGEFVLVLTDSLPGSAYSRRVLVALARHLELGTGAAAAAVDVDDDVAARGAF